MKERDNSVFIFNIGFFLYAVYGFVTLDNYGIPLDEQTQRFIGILNARFIAGHGSANDIVANGFFGPAYEMLGYVLEQIIYEAPLGTKFLLRHGVLFVFFLLAIRCFFSISRTIANHRNTALFGTLLFASYPLLFAHAHYNSKDTFFLCMTVFIFYFLNQYLKEKKWKYLILTSALIGVATTIRLHGVFLAAAILPTIIFSGESTNKWRIKPTIIFILLTLFFYVAFYPYLWLTGLQGLLNILGYVSQNPWPWNTHVFGYVAKPGALPWWYLPAWMAVTIPVISLLLFVFGLAIFLRKKKWENDRLTGSVLLVFVLPFLYFIIARPTIYDGWRHMQFLIVPLCFIGIYALDFWANILNKRIVTFAFVLYAGANFILWQPFGYVYFNEVYALMGKGNSYDQDYWGLSALPAMEWLAKDQSEGKIRTYCFLESAELNRNLLKKVTQDRFQFTRHRDSADFEIEFRRGRYFPTATGHVVHHLCPLKDTLVRIVKLPQRQ